MMRTTSRLIAVVAATLLGACGGITNAPFTQDGALVGTVGGPIDAPAAWVVARPGGGRPAVVATVDVKGHFRIDGLHPGPVTVLASTGLGQAVNQSVTVFGGQDNEVTLASEPGAILEGIVTLDGEADSGETVVGIEGLPVSVTTGSDGRFRLTGLPEGCYQVFAKHPNHHQSSTGVCLDAGTTTDTALHLLSSGPGTAVPFCSTCTSDNDCGSGGRCVVHLDGDVSEQVCTRECTSDADCPAGYGCTDVSGLALSLCLPEAGSCAAVKNFENKTSCTTDADCSLPGLSEDGLCVNHACTVPCTDDSQCPSGSTCTGVSDTGVHVCQ